MSEEVSAVVEAPPGIPPQRLLCPQSADGYQVSPFNSEGSAPRFIIKDQHGDHYVLANHVGIKLIQLLDGHHTLEQLQEQLSAQGLHVSLEKIEQFIDLCNANQLLVEGSWRALTPEVAEKHRSRGKLGFYKQLFGSGPMLDWMAAHARWWLNPITILAALACMAAGILFVIDPPPNAGLAAPLKQITFQPADIVLTLLPLIFLIEVSLHELAHALACRVLGAQAGGFGFGLIWGVVPIFFTNTTDAYSIDSKYKRILISAAGPMVDLAFLGLFALIAWNLTPGTMAYRFALGYTAFPMSTLLINLNPFLIRMDGYWMLADLVEEPNLRRSAFRYLRALVGRPFGRAPEENALRGSVDARGPIRWLYVAYSVIAFTWIAVFVVSFAYSIVTSSLHLVEVGKAFGGR